MRRCIGYWILVSLFCFVPAHAADVQPNVVSLDAQLAAILSDGPQPIFASSCSASANCASGTISCGPTSGSGTFVCVGVDQNCGLGENGYVQCGSVRQDCSPVCDPPSDPCDDFNQQYPGCGYTYDSTRECCLPSVNSLSCPQQPCMW